MLLLCMIYCCIHVSLDVLDVSPLLCNVDVIISTSQKRLQDGLLSLVGPLSSFRIGSHLGRDKLLSEPRPTIGSPLIDRVVWPLSSLEENCFLSLVISESRTSFYSLSPPSLW